MEDYHRGIFMHRFAFCGALHPLPHISPFCAPLPVFPLSPYSYPLLSLLPLIHIPSVCPIYTVDHLPIDSYCICTSLFILSLPPPTGPYTPLYTTTHLIFIFFPTQLWPAFNNTCKLYKKRQRTLGVCRPPFNAE